MCLCLSDPQIEVDVEIGPHKEQVDRLSYYTVNTLQQELNQSAGFPAVTISLPFPKNYCNKFWLQLWINNIIYICCS